MQYDKCIGLDGVPFFSQRLNEENYKNEGFSSLKDAFSWSNRICGLACLKMAITYQCDSKAQPLKELLEVGLRLSAYKRGIGWVHEGLIKIASEYGLQGGCESLGTEVVRILKYLKEQKLVIASVSPAFEGGMTYRTATGDTTEIPRGGHLVVVTHALFDKDNLVGFRVHHPSSEKAYEWPNKNIGIETFSRSFSSAGNIIFLGKK